MKIIKHLFENNSPTWTNRLGQPYCTFWVRSTRVSDNGTLSMAVGCGFLEESHYTQAELDEEST